MKMLKSRGLWRAAAVLLLAAFLIAAYSAPAVYAHGEQKHGSEQEGPTPGTGTGNTGTAPGTGGAGTIKPPDEVGHNDGHTKGEEGDAHAEEEEADAHSDEPVAETRLALELKDPTGEGIAARAVVTDSMGMALMNAPVWFYRKTSFGRLRLGPVMTNQEGVATVVVPAKPGQKIEVSAIFAGSATLARSESSTSVDLPPSPEAGRRPPGGLTTPYPNPLHVLLIVVIVGGVWVTYGTVVYTLFRIKREGRLAS